MTLDYLCDDVLGFLLEYLEYEEIVRLSQTNGCVFQVCDEYVHRDVGVSVAELYHFTEDKFENAPSLRDGTLHNALPLRDGKKIEIREEWEESNGFPISAFDTLSIEPCHLTLFAPMCSTSSWIS